MKNTYNTYAMTPTLLQKENNIVKVALLSQASHTRDVFMHQSITNWKTSVVYCYLLFISNFLWLSAFWPYVPHVAGQADRLVADDFRSWGRQNWHFVNSLKIFWLNRTRSVRVLAWLEPSCHRVTHTVSIPRSWKVEILTEHMKWFSSYTWHRWII